MTAREAVASATRQRDVDAFPEQQLPLHLEVLPARPEPHVSVAAVAAQ
jgi:hypothetical protein